MGHARHFGNSLRNWSGMNLPILYRVQARKETLWIQTSPGFCISVHRQGTAQQAQYRGGCVLGVQSEGCHPSAWKGAA